MKYLMLALAVMSGGVGYATAHCTGETVRLRKQVASLRATIREYQVELQYVDAQLAKKGGER